MSNLFSQVSVWPVRVGPNEIARHLVYIVIRPEKGV